MNIRVIAVGKTSQTFVREGLSIYMDRLTKYNQAELVEVNVPEIKSNLQSVIMQTETAAIEKHIRPGDHVVMCHDTGKEMSSEELSTWLQKKMNSGMKTLTFVVGGAYGVTPDFRKRANETIAFSRLTFTHDMIRLIIAEQLYRAFTIIKGEKYHH